MRCADVREAMLGVGSGQEAAARHAASCVECARFERAVRALAVCGAGARAADLSEAALRETRRSALAAMDRSKAGAGLPVLAWLARAPAPAWSAAVLAAVAGLAVLAWLGRKTPELVAARPAAPERGALTRFGPDAEIERLHLRLRREVAGFDRSYAGAAPRPLFDARRDRLRRDIGLSVDGIRSEIYGRSAAGAPVGGSAPSSPAGDGSISQREEARI